MLTFHTEFSDIVAATIASVSVPIDVVAQMFSRAVTITTIAICIVGFIILLVKKKMRDLDKAIFLTGVVYSGVGIVVYTLGSRTIAIIFIPISLGASYLLESKFGKYIKSFFLVLLILFAFIPLHTTFYDSQITFQTKEAYQTENFFVDHYNSTSQALVLAHVRAITYGKNTHLRD